MTSNKIALHWQDLDAKRGDRHLVFTNGCFDILHPGHVEMLEEARSHGDRLCVAVNSDASVRRLKGSERPVNTLAARMRVLAGLGCVDHVTHFDQDTPLELIQWLRPGILVKGGDYTLDTIVGASDVHGYGGRVLVIRYQDGYSTTSLLERIRK